MAGWATKIEGNTIPCSVPAILPARNTPYVLYALRETVGVAGQVIPWNFPLLMAAWKLGPGAGLRLHRGVETGGANTAFRAASRRNSVMEAGFPEGVVNIVPGLRRDRGSGAGCASGRGQNRLHRFHRSWPNLLSMPRTGNPEKKFSLELGGKSHNVVTRMPISNRPSPEPRARSSSIHGQCCCAGSRPIIEKPVFDRVVEGSPTIAKKINVGFGASIRKRKWDRSFPRNS